ncbi:MAG: DUF3095 domain-containing protein [Campylobacteraceae bacterium]|nr:DUF3095 domain-containing protein [Campylobacteraceae bacterium]
MNDNFYKDLRLLKDFSKISDTSLYTKVPGTWYVLVSDVKNSTKQIEEGKYKQINMVGALTIISILNLKKELDIPYIFGGDGSFLLIPKSLLDESKQALLAVKELSKVSYGLDLRVGVIPVKKIYELQKSLYIAKYEVSKDYFQAIIKGGGLDLSDELLKKDETFYIKEEKDETFDLDISGLECRWEAIKTPKDENLTILIKAFNDDYYKTILEKLDEILGSNDTRNPITKEDLVLSFQDKNLDIEASLFSQSFLGKLLIRQKLKLINLIGKFLMRFDIDKWGSYKQRIVSTTDNEKFDDMLRMVVSTSFKQTKLLEAYLQNEQENKNIVYGIHKSDSSLMTCLIFERHGKHVHFVDGSNGGYALAAKQLKLGKQK